MSVFFRYDGRVTIRLDAIGIVTADMAASLRFYALLGVPVPDYDAAEDHLESTLPNGLRIMWDSLDLVKQLDQNWTAPVGQRTGMAFHCGDAAGVDSTYQAVLGAGFKGAMEPFDAFWGQRYAQIVDPDGSKVDLFAPLG